MKIKYGVLALLVLVVLWTAFGLSEEVKPNFSGTWTLDKDKSDLGNMSRQGGDGSHRGGGLGRVLGGLGGRSGRSGGGPSGSGMGMPANSLVIEHEEPNIIIKHKMNADGEERVRELRYTTDGKETTTQGSRQGMSMRSKTQWEGNQLVTKSNVETPMGRMEIEEVRSLSADGNELTVEVTRKGGTQRLVYRKE